MGLVRTRCLSILILLAAAAFAAAGPQSQRNSGDPGLSGFEWVEGLEIEWAPLEGRSGQPEAEKSPGLWLRFFAWGRHFDLRLQPARLFADQSRNVWVGTDGHGWEEPPQQIFYQGQLHNEPGSAVRLTIQQQQIEGLVMSGGDAFFLEPAGRFFPAAGPSEMVAYRLDPLLPLSGGHRCSLEGSQSQPHIESGLAQAGAALRALLDQLRMLAGASAARVIEIRLVADSYYYQIHRSASASRMQGIIHQVNPIFEQQSGLTFRIAETRVWTSRSQDQVGSSTDPGQLLDEFSTAEQVGGNDLVHLFTGRDLDGGSVGEARLGGICHESQATALSQDLSNAQLRTVLAAHELGHNLGSRHDGERSCSEVPPEFIMWPALSANFRRFSDCSLGSFSRRLERAPCVAPLAGQPLPAPHIISPEGQVTARFPVFEWQPVQGAQSYRVQIYDQTEDRLIIDHNLSLEFLQPSDPLPRGHNFRWRVAAADSWGEGEQSAWRHFEIQALAAPQAMAPSGTVHTSRPSFHWQGVQGSASYLLEVEEEDGDEALVHQTDLVQFQPPQGMKGTRFRWRVSSVDEAGSLSPGSWMRFAVRAARPSSGPRGRP